MDPFGGLRAACKASCKDRYKHTQVHARTCTDARTHVHTHKCIRAHAHRLIHNPLHQLPHGLQLLQIQALPKRERACSMGTRVWCTTARGSGPSKGEWARSMRAPRTAGWGDGAQQTVRNQRLLTPALQAASKYTSHLKKKTKIRRLGTPTLSGPSPTT